MGDGRGGRSGGGGRELSRGDGRGKPSGRSINKGKGRGRGKVKPKRKNGKTNTREHPAQKSNITKAESDPLIKKYKPLRIFELNRRIREVKDAVARQLELLKNYVPSNPKIPKITEIDWEHIFNGGWNKAKDKIVGFHSTYLHPEFINRMHTMPNAKGIYRVVVKKLKKIKMDPSTMFPDNWDGKKIMEKIIEAYKNPVEISSGRFGETTVEGLTKEGIKIRMVITKTGMLDTAFTLMK